MGQIAKRYVGDELLFDLCLAGGWRVRPNQVCVTRLDAGPGLHCSVGYVRVCAFGQLLAAVRTRCPSRGLADRVARTCSHPELAG